MTGKKKVTF